MTPPLIVPVSRVPITVRAATMGDYPFIDRLQGMHSKALGFMPKAQLEGKIARGEVLVAEDEARLPIGYCISSDRYFKHDDVGIIYQMNVSPGVQRKLVGATLLRAVFERAPYGCRLFCCWCAQDLDANYFWESLGFVPLAFRAGAGGKRTHIFWQRRIREGDTTTPYWFPAKTDGGHMREDRIVLPIPPGVHWKDPMPILLPEAQKALPDSEVARAPRPCRKKSTSTGEAPVPQLMPPTRRRVQFGAAPIAPAPEPVAKTKPAKQKREKVKADPVLVAKARELRDRWLEKVNEDPALLLSGGAQGKYAVGRELTESSSATPQLLLPAA